MSSEVANNQFSIKTDKPNVKVSWQITGVRQDAWAKAHPLVVEKEKNSRERGRYTPKRGLGGLGAALAAHRAVKSILRCARRSLAVAGAHQGDGVGDGDRSAGNRAAAQRAMHAEIEACRNVAGLAVDDFKRVVDSAATAVALRQEIATVACNAAKSLALRTLASDSADVSHPLPMQFPPLVLPEMTWKSAALRPIPLATPWMPSSRK